MERIYENWINEVEGKYLENEELTGDTMVYRAVFDPDCDYVGVFSSFEDVEKLFYFNYVDEYCATWRSFELPCTTEHDFYSDEPETLYVVVDHDNDEIVSIYIDEEEANEAICDYGNAEVYAVAINEFPSLGYVLNYEYYKDEETGKLFKKSVFDPEEGDDELWYLEEDLLWYEKIFIEENEMEEFISNLTQISEDEALSIVYHLS